MKFKVAFSAILLIASSFAAASSAVVADPGAEICTSSGDMNFLCGPSKPEDLVVLPGNRWIVSSGMTTASGLHLIDTETKTSERWIAAPVAAPQAPYGDCPAQPLPDEFQAHGISIRDRGNGHVTLYAVNHGGSQPIDTMTMVTPGGHETIEVFDVDLMGTKPALSWLGCVPMPSPQFLANSVASTADGSIYATVMLEPGHTVPEIFRGVATGAVYKWSPGAAGFERITGTDLPGNNGIEVSADGKRLYVASSYGAVTAFTNTTPARRIRTVATKIGIADNMHWVNGRLILAGQRTDICSAKDARAHLVPGAMWGPGLPCMAGYYVAEINAQTLAVTVLAKGGANASFVGATTGLPIGDTLWLGSVRQNRVAYRLFP